MSDKTPTPTTPDLDAAFADIGDDVVIDFTALDLPAEADGEASTTPEPVTPPAARNEGVVAEMEKTPVVVIKVPPAKADGKKKGAKKGRSGQTPECAARCDIVRAEILGRIGRGLTVVSSDFKPDYDSDRFKYTDVKLVASQLLAAGKISETKKGGKLVWAAPVK